MSDEPSEAEIVRGLRLGDRAAWDALCERYETRLWHYITRLIGSQSHQVADVYQETMMAVARSGRRLQEDSRLWPWLARIAHNQTALYWRQHYRTQSESLELKDVCDNDQPPLSDLDRSETAASIRGLLTEMKAEHVTLLTAKYIDGLSVAEIVKAFGGTTESVRSQLARARRDFRERYQRVAAQR